MDKQRELIGKVRWLWEIVIGALLFDVGLACGAWGKNGKTWDGWFLVLLITAFWLLFALCLTAYEAGRMKDKS